MNETNSNQPISGSLGNLNDLNRKNESIAIEKGALSPVCCPDNLFNLISGLSTSLAWPIIVLIIFLALRERISKVIDHIIQLIPDTQKFSAGGNGFVWERSMEILKNDAEESENSIKRSKESSVFLETNGPLAKLYPRGAIIEAWISVQSTLFNLISHSITIDSDSNYRKQLDELLKRQLITRDQYRRIQHLADARNQAVHGFITPTSTDAIAYIKVAGEVISELKKVSI